MDGIASETRVGVPSEYDIILACQRGEETAFASLYDHHAPKAYRIACLLLGDRCAAEEAVQDAFLRAFRAIGRFRAGAPFEPWFTRILVNECRRQGKALRHAAHTRATRLGDTVGDTSEADQAENLQDPRASADQWSERMAVRSALAKLSRTYKEAVVLHYFAGLTIKETSSTLKCPQGTVKFRLFEARRHLERILNDC